MSTDLKKIIKMSSTKSSLINDSGYQDTLAAQIAKADIVLGLALGKNNKADVEVIEKILITLPANEHKNLNYIIEKYLSLGKHITKSELVRLGIFLVDQLSDENKVSKLKLVPKLRSGRKKSTNI